MAKYVVDGKSLTAIADTLRNITGKKDALKLAQMPTELTQCTNAMQVEIWELREEKQNYKDESENLKGTIEGLREDNADLTARIEELESAGGGENLDDVIAAQADLIEQLSTILDEKSQGGGDSDLPSGCRRVDYIQFNGKRLVDTGIIGNQDTQVSTSFTWESNTQNNVYGCASSGNTASITSYMNGSWRFGNKYQTKNLSSKNPLLPYSALVNKSTISLNSSVTPISDVNDFETVGTLLLGGARTADGDLPSSGIVGKIFYFILWQGGVQVLKLIPVVDAEGNYHFWDVIGKKFHDSITETPLEGGNL